MGRKRVSLAELQKQEINTSLAESEEGLVQQDFGTNQGLAKPPTELSAPASKSLFIKLSVTVPPEMFDQLDTLSRFRRKQGRPFTKSDLVREALEPWLKKSLLK